MKNDRRARVERAAWVDKRCRRSVGGPATTFGVHDSVVPSTDDLSRFIASSFPSVWSLELLLLLKAERRPWTQDQLIGSLRASELVVSQALESLVAGGLASLSDDGVEYMPVSDSVAVLVDQTEELYRRKPDAVRRMVVMSGASEITAFADAFRLRKE